MSVIPAEAVQRLDESPDEEFYLEPRFVTHIDDLAIATVTQIYRNYFPPGGAILDLMGSWVSHLPEEVKYRRVVGLGMNGEELAANSRLSAYVIHNLNREPRLPFAEAEFDAAGICVSIDYLTQPVAVLRDLGRVLKPQAPMVITFSNRCFPTKVIKLWLVLDDSAHQRLVKHYLLEAGNWANVELLDRSPGPGSDPLYAVIARSMGPYEKR